MRNVWMGFLLAGMTGCSTQAVNFEHQSELEVNTRGVALLDNGLHGQVGMYGTTCRVNVADASIGEDYEFPGDDEAVVDAGTIDDAAVVLVVSDIGAHLTFHDTFGVQPLDFEDATIVDGAVYNDGIVTLHDDGSVKWWVDGNVVATQTDVALSNRLTVTPEGIAFVGTTNGVVVVDGEGSSTTIDGAELVTWDEFAGVLYTAAAGDTWLSGVEGDGTVRWTTEMPGAIVAIDTMGPLASAAVMVEHANGTGELVTVDGYTGEITSSLTTPSAARSIHTSGNGRSMALALDREVHFFNVRGSAF